MKFIAIFLFSMLTLSLLTLGCKEEGSKTKRKVLIDPDKQSEFDNLVSAINASSPSDSGVSLRYQNDNNTSKQLYLYLYENIECTKWVYEEIKDGITNKTTTFYFNKGKLFHSNELTFSENSVYQTNSYYNEKMEGIYSSERSSENYLDIEKAALKPRAFVNHNFKECLNLKDSKGEFSLKFVELINFEGIDFIRLGQKENSGFWTDLIVPQMTDSISNLGKSKENIGKPVKISFITKKINGIDFQELGYFSY
jgi:hypothetical protein